MLSSSGMVGNCSLQSFNIAKKRTDIQYIEITVIITVSYCHTIDALVQ